MTGAPDESSPPPGYLGAGGPIHRGPSPELVEAGYALELADAPLLGRGLGLADLAQALATHRPHRASGALALHVLEIIDAVTRSSSDHVVVPLTTTVERPEPVPAGSAPDTW